MLKIKKLLFKNLLSIGNNPVVIDFDNKLNTLITGRNGHGKSAILSALVFSLYGKDFRGINKNGLINSINKKNLLTEVEFERNGIVYKVRRGIKPNIFEIYQNDVLLNQQASVRDQQNWFETEILRFPYNTFKQIVTVGSGNYIPFMKLSASQRREFIEDLLDLSAISLMQNKLKEKIQFDRESYREQDSAIKLNESKIDFINDQFRRNSELTIETRNNIESDIKAIETDIIDIDVNIKLLVEKVKLIEEKKSSFDDKQKEYDILNNSKVSLKTNIDRISSVTARIDTLDICPTCRQHVSHEHKENVSEKYGIEKRNLENELEEIQLKINDMNSIFEKQKELFTASLAIDRKFGSLEAQKIKNYEKKEYLIKQLEQLSNSENIERDNLTHLLSQQKVLKEKLIEIKEKIAINDMLSLILKDSGIKAVMIKQYIDYINQLVNKYLDLFEFFVSFNIDENFSEKIKSRFRDEFTYENFSEGEKMRIDLSLLFTFREISKLKSNLDCNLIFFDEVLDSAMDIDGLSSLYKIFDIMGDTTIYVISHRVEASDMFDRTLRAIKTNNFSTLEIIDE